MIAVFADTSYYLAFLSSSDARHAAAVEWGRHVAKPIVTTEFVLLETGNFLSSSKKRGAFRLLLAYLKLDPNIHVVPASTELFGAGTELYLRWPDKDWSLTDCISFVVMKQHSLTEALTADRHFEQAGFKALLR